MKKPNEISSLEFSICLNECEDFCYEVQSDYGDREDKSEDIDHDQVNTYIHSLVGKVKGFFIGEHRTYGNIYYYDDNTMEITFHDYPQPDFDEQDHFEILDIPTILPNF
jgi:hypothetical protein